MTPNTEEPTEAVRFRTDAPKRAKLQALLNDPILAEAFDIADDQMRPRAGGATDGNQMLAVAKFHQSAGVREFRDKLKDLTRPVRDVVAPKLKTLAKTIDDLPKENK